MTALKKQNSRTKVYGWAAVSANYSTSSTNSFPLTYGIFPNRVELNQGVIYVERLPETVQNKHFDFTYHVTAFLQDRLSFYDRQGLLEPAVASKESPLRL